jgi:hypothetical protein
MRVVSGTFALEAIQCFPRNERRYQIRWVSECVEYICTVAAQPEALVTVGKLSHGAEQTVSKEPCPGTNQTRSIQRDLVRRRHK